MSQQTLLGLGAGDVPVGIEEVFQSFIYEGNDSNMGSVSHGIKSSKGMLIWGRCLTDNNGSATTFYDTSMSAGYRLESDSDSGLINAYNSGNGTGSFWSTSGDSFHWIFKGTNGNDHNASGELYLNNYFRKQKHFFDFVTYTGNGSNNHSISHSLGSYPGLMIVKRTDGTGDWICYHNNVGITKYLKLNTDDQATTDSSVWANVGEDTIQLNSSSLVNGDGNEYVAYLWAVGGNQHAVFGQDMDKPIIKAGNFTYNGTGVNVDCDFEPQWVIAKSYSGGNSDWYMWDTTAGFDTTEYIQVNVNDAGTPSTTTNGNNYIEPYSKGFRFKTGGSGRTYMYLAISAETGRSILDITNPGEGQDSKFRRCITGRAPAANTGYAFHSYLVGRVDAALRMRRDSYASTHGGLHLGARLSGSTHILMDTLATEQSDSSIWWQSMAGCHKNVNYNGNSNFDCNMFRRHKGFDVMVYKGGHTNTPTHNLNQVPQMIWTKRRDSSNNSFIVWHYGMNSASNAHQYYCIMDTTAAEANYDWTGGNGAPTATQVKMATNHSTWYDASNTSQYIAYLFASVPKICKLGYYTGNGSTQTITTDFTPNMIYVKCVSNTSNHMYFDNEYGRLASTTQTDEVMALNINQEQHDSNDYIDNISSTGFGLTNASSGDFHVNTNGYRYVYWAHS